MASQRLGIPAIAHEECLTGLAAYGATAFPTPLAWAATFDEALVEQMARAIGEDMRAFGVHQGLAPVVDVVKDYRWGRVEETLGEDPYLVAQLGAACVAASRALASSRRSSTSPGTRPPAARATTPLSAWDLASSPTRCCRPSRPLCGWAVRAAS